MFYRLASERVEELWSALRSVAAEHVAGIRDLADAYLGDRRGLETIGANELAARLRRGDVVVLDVRPRAEFQSGHIAGARSVPIDELRRHLKTLPKDTEVVAYCRGRYCAYADDAVRTLQRRGYPARRLEDGYPEWRRARLPIAEGESS
jgi:rhodanese-related sulfurtransferase